MSVPELIDVDEKFALFSEHWRPKTLAELNGQEFKAVRICGEFPWHQHDVDEMFFAWKGEFDLEFRSGTISMKPGQLIVIPAGVEHRPVARSEAQIFLIEPIGTRNTGNLEDEAFTAPDRSFI